ncbi:exotoxin beta-grasp domain-containing protein [Staphylococcus aureus]|uniref:exotoxin beta-grasp domain-containing protein n=1 Tax=Staphylococcus aureus TaxID=1280 RepID=UPI00044911EF|nr:hypothetical protein [Staphylococcus aureus]EGQ0541967.1 superantigen-like protein [Staphylococcus aureus]EZY59348.1 hypothetical protein V060_02748 [Staphylococcus aureus R0294]EZY59625.1 hypothetical protein V061_02754 [Staphylococcus aureus R0353]EZY61936.1 hypothetical protein V062_02731 [Staphylococcus aureus R0357]EZY67330.1 hypothetical protein V064_02721 [Staphylococcus aureus R0545]
MKKQILNKIILSSSITLAAAISLSTTNTSLNTNQAHAYHIDNEETNQEKLKEYYTQTPEIFSNKQISLDNVTKKYYVRIQYAWGAYINLTSPSEWGNVNKLNNKQVDVFGLKDRSTEKYFWSSVEHFTGGVTPAAQKNDPEHSLSTNVSVIDNKQYIEYSYELSNFLKTKKQYITLKEIDFRIREAVAKQGFLYSKGFNYGTITITMKDGTSKSIDLSKRLVSDQSNEYLETANIKNIKIDVKNVK